MSEIESLPSDMQVVEIDGPGSYDQLHLRQKPMPKLLPGGVIVRVAAFGVNYAGL